MIEDDDDWPDISEPIEVECDHCGDVKLCILSEDPFKAEVYPEDENEPSYYCHKCYRARQEEV